MTQPAAGSEPGHPRVSIVVPAYNREDYLGLTLDSVLAQTTTSWELVVSDDGSTDGTRSLAAQYASADPRIRVVSGANAGVATARNRGYAATDRCSEYTMFLDSDDVWEPDALEVLLDVIDTHPEYVSVYGVARCIDHRGERIAGDDLEERTRERLAIGRDGLVPVAAGEPTTFAGMVFHNWVGTPGLQLTRRAVIGGGSAFDPETDPADDWDYAIRVSRGGDIGFVDRTLLNWRRHDGSLTTTSRNQSRAHFRVRRKTLTDPQNTPEQRRVARLAWVLMSRDMVRNARRLFGQRQFERGGRQAVRAVEGVTRYWLATAMSSGRRIRRRSSVAPSSSGR